MKKIKKIKLTEILHGILDIAKLENNIHASKVLYKQMKRVDKKIHSENYAKYYKSSKFVNYHFLLIQLYIQTLMVLSYCHQLQ
jgi:hypothetical protein